ncbi:hypothetical protein BC332_33970 [Capsicum chinense]|nr:hypothetical protein BC332_33970 [Capsicum chinense]
MTDLNSLVMDDDYEFSAPKFYDFINGETEEEKRKSLCDFTKDEELQDNARPVRPNVKEEPAVVVTSSRSKEEVRPNGNEERVTVLKSSGSTEEVRPNRNEECAAVLTSSGIKEIVRPSGIEECAAELSSSGNKVEVKPNEIEKPAAELASSGSKVVIMPKEIVKESEVSTPTPPMISQKSDKNTDSKKRQTAKKIASILRNPSALKTKARLQQSQLKKNSNPASARKQAITKSVVGTYNLAQENQAIKRQKLEGGKSKPNLPYKAKVGVASSSSTLFALTAEVHKQNRKMYAQEPVPPFVSIAEMMKKFQSSTREMSLPPMSNSTSQDDPAGKIQRKHKLILTKPKEPEFVTAQRVRPTRVKSSAELEEEMMAKIPKFKARPLNKKAGERPSMGPFVFLGYLGGQMGETARTGHFWANLVRYSPQFMGWARDSGMILTKKRSGFPGKSGEQPSVGYLFWAVWVVKLAKQRKQAIFGPIRCAIMVLGRNGVNGPFLGQFGVLLPMVFGVGPRSGRDLGPKLISLYRAGRLGRGLIWAILVFRVVWVVKRAKQHERAIFGPIWCAIAHGFRGGREVQHNFGPKSTELPQAGGERPNVGHFSFGDIWVVKRVKRHEWAIFGPILCAISHGLRGRPGVRVRYLPKIDRPALGRLRSGLVWAILFFLGDLGG